jgi:hypothetical protein
MVTRVVDVLGGQIWFLIGFSSHHARYLAHMFAMVVDGRPSLWWTCTKVRRFSTLE